MCLHSITFVILLGRSFENMREGLLLLVLAGSLCTYSAQGQLADGYLDDTGLCADPDVLWCMRITPGELGGGGAQQPLFNWTKVQKRYLMRL